MSFRAQRDLKTFKFAPSDLKLLNEAGFITTDDLKGVRVVELAKELKITNQKALALFQILKGEEFQTNQITIKNTNNSNNDNPIDNNTNNLNIRPIGNIATNNTNENESKNNFVNTFLSPANNKMLGVKRMKSEPKTAFELLEEESERKKILTLNQDLDELLGDGISLGQVTEFCGYPGIGKTQLGIQIAVNTFIPKKEGGVEGEVIYVDTEGSFEVSRVEEIASHLVCDLLQLKQSQTSDHLQTTSSTSIEKEEITVEKIMEGISYYRLHDYLQQLAFVKILPFLIEQKKGKIKTVIIDSVAFHFRAEFKDYRKRTRLLNSMSLSLLQIAEKYELAVILMNQVTTKFHQPNNINLNNKQSSTSTLVPALGESWGHNSTNRILLYFEEDQRKAHLHKSPSLPSKTVSFTVCEKGIR